MSNSLFVNLVSFVMFCSHTNNVVSSFENTCVKWCQQESHLGPFSISLKGSSYQESTVLCLKGVGLRVNNCYEYISDQWIVFRVLWLATHTWIYYLLFASQHFAGFHA